MPPEKLVRIRSSRSSGDGMPTFPSASARAHRAASLLTRLCARMASIILHVDAQDRIERHHRILENHRDPVPAHAALLLRTQRALLDAVEHDAAGGQSFQADR
jgi:hypothetical protein